MGIKKDGGDLPVKYQCAQTNQEFQQLDDEDHTPLERLHATRKQTLLISNEIVRLRMREELVM